MKLVFYYIVCLVAVALQVTILGGDYSLNIVLASIVATAAFLRASDVIPIALITGLLLDLHTGMPFGFNILFLLFAVLIAKFVLHLGEKSTGFWDVIVTLGILEVLRLFAQLVLVFSVDKYQQVGTFVTSAIWQIIFTLLIGGILYGFFIKMQDYIGAGRVKKHWVWGK